LALQVGRNAADRFALPNLFRGVVGEALDHAYTNAYFSVNVKRKYERTALIFTRRASRQSKRVALRPKGVGIASKRKSWEKDLFTGSG
jgi:hypothetical protein